MDAEPNLVHHLFFLAHNVRMAFTLKKIFLIKRIVIFHDVKIV